MNHDPSKSQVPSLESAGQDRDRPQRGEGADASIDGQLAGLRGEIDRLDREILERLSERARMAQAVGHIKHARNETVYRPEREAAVIARLQGLNPGPIPALGVAQIWREIMSTCRSLERRMAVAYLGPAGTFSEQAVRQRFGQDVDPQPCSNIDEVFRLTEAKGVDFGVVPVENWTEGPVNRSLDLFLTSAVTVSGEITVAVRHTLMSQSGDMAGVTRICAHPQAFGQCQNWLNRHHPAIERVPVSSNAEGARLASLDPATAAIAGDTALVIYGLKAVVRSIQDDPMNRTRFLVIGDHRCSRSGNDQTSLILSVPDRAGAVHALIEPLARHGVSMKRFESRPARQGGWEYHFYIDVIGHEEDAHVAAALEELRRQATFYKSLGSYPCEVGLSQ